ncbi:hypothetical protein [Paenibacillus taichungensis]|uniref:hypothetical protein n=1 Tax=Paenibacillus taichungensis TaxID=484184 RepID=UPI0035DB56BE
MKKSFDVGATYNAVFHGQIWSFIFNQLDPEDDQVIWITWATGEEEGYSIEEMSPHMDEYETIIAAGVIYPKGNSDEAQAEGLAELIAQPTYIFAGMEVPRSFVLTDHFSPTGYRPDGEYMNFTFDQDKQILTMTTPDPDAAVPQWLIDRLSVVGISKIDPLNVHKKTTFHIEVENDRKCCFGSELKEFYVTKDTWVCSLACFKYLSFEEIGDLRLVQKISNHNGEEIQRELTSEEHAYCLMIKLRNS